MRESAELSGLESGEGAPDPSVLAASGLRAGDHPQITRRGRAQGVVGRNEERGAHRAWRGGEAEMRSLPLRCSRRSGRSEVATDRDEDLGGGEGHRQTYEDAPSGLGHVSGNLE